MRARKREAVPSPACAGASSCLRVDGGTPSTRRGQDGRGTTSGKLTLAAATRRRDPASADSQSWKPPKGQRRIHQRCGHSRSSSSRTAKPPTERLSAAPDPPSPKADKPAKRAKGSSH